MRIRWQPHIGKYLHRCDECSNEFDGRKNQLFCSATCKAKHNNDIACVRRNDEKGLTSAYIRNVEIIRDELGDIENEVIAVPMQRLLALGFDSQAPNKRIRIGNDPWYEQGPFAYRPLEQTKEVELFKIKKDESNHTN